MKTILLIGPAPQNIGGISIHIRRLVELLKDEYFFDYVDEGHVRYNNVFNLRSFNIYSYLKKVINTDIVHIQSGHWLLRLFHILVCKLLIRKNKVIVTIHRDPTIEPFAWITKWLLGKCDYSVIVNSKGYDFLRKPSKCKYILLPAFIPPKIENEPPLTKEIIDWLETAKINDGYVLCSNAWNLVLHNGEDLYGLDICIEAMKYLKNNEKKYYLVFVVASNSNQLNLIDEYKERIVRYGLGDRILILEQSISFIKLILESDLVLRTTNTDGDAISVREALYLGKPVLASDVVARPEGTYLYRTRNVEDLAANIVFVSNQVLENQYDRAINYREIYMQLYK